MLQDNIHTYFLLKPRKVLESVHLLSQKDEKLLTKQRKTKYNQSLIHSVSFTSAWFKTKLHDNKR